jgi:hypothetical protein
MHSMKKQAKKRSGMTAAELVAELNVDPKWVAAQEAQERETNERCQEWARAEAPSSKS